VGGGGWGWGGVFVEKSSPQVTNYNTVEVVYSVSKSLAERDSKRWYKGK